MNLRLLISVLGVLAVGSLHAGTPSGKTHVEERQAIVCVISWFSPIGVFHGTTDWAPGAYKYELDASNPVRNLPLLAPIAWPEKPPAVGSLEYYQTFENAIRHDQRNMKSAGFDVATFDMLPNTGYNPSQPLTETNTPFSHYKTFLSWLKVAEETGMKIGIMPDVKTPGGKVPTVGEWSGLIKNVLKLTPNSPALWRIDNRPVLIHFGTDSYYGTYAPDKKEPKPLGGWDKILDNVRKTHPNFYFVADIRPHPQVSVWNEVADAVHMFAPASPDEFLVDVQPKLASNLSIPLVWTVSPNYYRTKSAYTEPDFQRIHDLYNAAIKAGAKWVYVLTWNDFLEDTDIVPSRNKGRALLDVFGYYNAWFKSGTQPRLEADKVIISYPLRVPEEVHTRSPSYGRPDQRLLSTAERLSAPPYAPKVKYWAYVTKPTELEIPGVGSVIFKNAGLWMGELGTIKPGAVTARLGDRQIELPPVEQTVKEESRNGEGGLEHRYVELTAQP